ncbi:cysteine-rich secretory protein 1-like [Diorhabda sublineata]|uniref:cysteine-rich secretory protein 1-like n=1 Tax=Diorhabda sublineata TaxID=1163346 RepID=UPI0024E1463E|nr:cysteine-rich secretory protein 1-like [Diorhabda sublineata]
MGLNMTSKFIVFLVVLGFSINSISTYGNFNPKRKPKIMGDSIPLKMLDPRRVKLQKKIVLYHNFFRSKVDPPPANMLRMKYHHGAAKSAQRWANACKFLIHDNVVGRSIQNYGSCGQNIFVATQKVPWLFAIDTWWSEKDLFKYGKRNNLTTIGHYTQLVWANTHEVGCGVAKCVVKPDKTPFNANTFYNYVCNYCPIGNFPGRLGRPYIKGTPCSLCKKRCQKKLCKSTCNAADQFTDCKKLYKAFPTWLCNTYNTTEGLERRKGCLATCTCRRNINH